MTHYESDTEITIKILGIIFLLVLVGFIGGLCVERIMHVCPTNEPVIEIIQKEDIVVKELIYKCPGCKLSTLHAQDRYCSNCGVKIGWVAGDAKEE